MTPRSLFVAIAIVAVFNGLASPAVLFAMLIWPAWLPEILAVSPEVVRYMASLLVSAGTVILAGVPAAAYERAKGLATSDQTSMGLWLGAAIFLTLPAPLAAF